MADNFETNSASGGLTFASDDISSVHWPYTKMAFGADGTATLVTASVGLPISDAGGSLTVDGTVAATQSGTWTVDLGATDNAVLDSILSALQGTLTVGSHAVTNAGTFAVQAAQSGTWTVDLGATDNAVLDAIAASLAGTLTVGSHAVTNAGTFAVQAAQSGTWTVDLGATDNAVLDAIAASLAGTLTVGSHAVTNAGTFAVQAAQSGTWTVDLGATDNAVLDAIAASVAGTLAVSGTVTANLSATDNAVLDSIQAAVEGATPAGTNLIGKASVAQDTSAIYNGTTALTPKFAKISCSTSGDNALVAAVTSKKIRVLSIALIATDAVSVYFKSDGGTAIFADSTNDVPLDETGATGAGGLVLNHNPVGWFETASGEALELVLSGAVGVCGALTYVEV